MPAPHTNPSLWRAPDLSLRWWPVFLRNLLVWRKLAIPSLMGNIAEPRDRRSRHQDRDREHGEIERGGGDTRGLAVHRHEAGDTAVAERVQEHREREREYLPLDQRRPLPGGPRSQNDYLELANQFHTVVLSDVPHMPVRLASEARRFTWLVDVLYDRRVKLVISAAVPPEELYTEGPMSHEFPRTVSRLNEMQSKEYLSEERRLVDTSLT